MKKIIILITAISFITINLVSQDFIYKRNLTDRIAATNINVQNIETTYNIFGDESGQAYSIANNDISMIAFENGEIRFFEREKKIAHRRNFKKNIINYHLFDLVVNNFKISYERIVSNGKIGIQIPFAIGYGDEDNLSGFDDVYNKFYTGISLNFYPTGQGAVRYFMGPGIQIGNGFFNDGYSNGYGQYTEANIDTFVFRFLINNGIMFTPIEALSISLVGSLGIRYTDKVKYNNDNNVKTVGAFSANLSYRF
jgi:hypothetical protein